MNVPAPEQDSRAKGTSATMVEPMSGSCAEGCSVLFFYARQDSNLQPSVPKTDALSN